jgi:hypothetical protein
MKIKINNAKKAGTAIGCIAAIFIVMAVYGVSWLITCGVIKLITMCFGWTFTWGTATGVWLLMCLARAVFGNAVTVKK